MSGGSYNYLCCKDSSELMEAQDEIENMAARLSELGYADHAAKETQDVLQIIQDLSQIIRRYEIQVAVVKGRLDPVWKAVEWWDSGDSGEDELKAALKEYRKL